MRRFVSSLVLLSLMIVSAAVQSRAQASPAEAAGLDAQGNIYVSSDTGKRIIVGNTSRCSGTTGSPDRQTIACMVKEDPQGANLMPSRKVEVYSRGGVKQTIQPGSPIRDWHFWDYGSQIVLLSGESGHKGTYGLYDSATGVMVQHFAEPSDDSLLPQWAKNRLQIDNDSVPSGPQFSRERTMWITKVLYQIGKLQPGMQRKDLLKLFTEEGGFSTRAEKTYVYRECDLIKVDVRFKSASNGGDPGKEDPEDVIESISRPYLAWRIFD